MKIPNMICVDMDNTIADLYNIPDWLPKLRAYDPSPYADAEPMWDMTELAEAIRAVQTIGIEIRIITWLSKDSTPEYDSAVRQAKRTWLDQYDFPYDHFHGVAYGTTKADSIRKYLGADETAMLIDDNSKVRQGWHMGEAIDPGATNLIELLYGLVDQYFEEE